MKLLLSSTSCLFLVLCFVFAADAALRVQPRSGDLSLSSILGTDWREKIRAVPSFVTDDTFIRYVDGNSATVATLSNNSNHRQSCQAREACWPTEEQVGSLKNDLNASSFRNLNWAGYPQGQPTAVPQQSDWAQPYYGLGENATSIEALYSNPDLGHLCYTGGHTGYPYPYGKSFNGNGSSDFCKAATRNRPYKGYTPSFVAFCQNSAHVVAALQFAVDHNLCVMVVGSGHEYLNRHSCPGGMMIRTAAMQDKQFLPDYGNQTSLSAPAGAFKFGPGLTFSSAIAYTTQFQRVIVGGWCSTVGLIGWSLGGGHGPLAPSLGLGVDNTLEFEVVQVHQAAEGRGKVIRHLVVNEKENPALFWAMKGGGGSVWGIITSITLRAHQAQPKGYPQLNISTNGTFCTRNESGSGEAHNLQWLKTMLQNYADWQVGLSSKFALQSSMWPQTNQVSSGDSMEDRYCKASWTFILTYIYNGDVNEPAHQAAYEALVTILDPRAGDSNNLTVLPTYYHEVTQYGGDEFRILPQPAQTTNNYVTGAQSSILLSREQVANDWAVMFTNILEWCPQHGQCGFHYLYTDFTGNIGSPQPEGTSLSPGMRSYLLLHLARNLSVTQLENTMYSVSNYTYFSESAFVMPRWGEHYWGLVNFDLLRAVKKLYDPFDIFWCHHCIGDDPNSAD